MTSCRATSSAVTQSFFSRASGSDLSGLAIANSEAIPFATFLKRAGWTTVTMRASSGEGDDAIRDQP